MDFILTCVYILAAVLGLCVGSFLNVVIYRVPLGMSLAKPGSHCTQCQYALRWYDNIPVLSWLMLGGKCRNCKKPISVRYTIVELANGILWLACAVLFWQQSVVVACLCALASSALICIFFIDLEHMLIFNRFTLLIALCGVAAMVTDTFTAPWDHVIGAVAGGAVFAGLYFGALRLLGREGIGFGDVKLAAAAGLLLGWQKLILAMLIASVAGSIILMALRRLCSHEKDREYPFGPFIVVGVEIALLFGSPILNWYVMLLGGF